MPNQNAARLLADHLRGWQVPAGEKPEKVRGFKGINDLSGWRAHERVMNLVRQVDDHITALDLAGQDVDVFYDSLPAWYAAAGFGTTPFGTPDNTAGRHCCSRTDLNMLTALSLLIDARPHPTVLPDEARALSDVLAEALELISTDEDLSTEVKTYLYVLIRRANLLVDQVSTYGAEAVRQVVMELSGALFTRSEAAPGSEKGQRFRSVANMLVAGFMGTAGGETAKMLGSAAKTGIDALGGG